MYNTGDDKLPKKPVISTLAAALEDITRWQHTHALSVIKDRDGQVWSVRISLVPVADPKRVDMLRLKLKVQLTTATSGVGLIATGVLSPSKDSRLLGMIGTAEVPMTMRPNTYLVGSEDEARALLAEQLPKLRATMAADSLADVKRHLVGRWVDEHSLFGMVDRESR